MPKGCFKHSNFLKVNRMSRSLNTMKRKQTRQHDGVLPSPRLSESEGETQQIQLRAF